jgi:hypothetical protein
MALQRCDNVDEVLDEVRPGQYIGFQTIGHLCTAIRMSQFGLISQGEAVIGEDGGSDYQVGNRSAAWVRLRHTVTDRIVFFVNYQGPTPLNSGGACGTRNVALRLLNLITSNGRPGDTVVLAGDFNANEDSETVRELKERLKVANVGTAQGGTDLVFTNQDGVVVANATNLGCGGSDHDALGTLLRVGPETTTTSTSTQTISTRTSTTTIATTTRGKPRMTTTTGKRGKLVLHTDSAGSPGSGEKSSFVDESVQQALAKLVAQSRNRGEQIDDSALEETRVAVAVDEGGEDPSASEEDVAVR